MGEKNERDVEITRQEYNDLIRLFGQKQFDMYCGFKVDVKNEIEDVLRRNALNKAYNASHSPLTDAQVAEKEENAKASKAQEKNAFLLGLDYYNFMVAKACNTNRIDFSTPVLAAIQEALKKKADASNVPKSVRDQKWEDSRHSFATATIGLADCHRAKVHFEEMLPHGLPDENQENPF